MHRFSFNLLPQKAKEVVIQEEKRDENSLYLAILPLFTVIIAIGIILVNYIVLESRVKAWEGKNENLDTQIETFRADVERNKELVDKSFLLEEPIQKDIEPENFFSLVDQIIAAAEFELSVRSYGRDNDGSFFFQFELQSMDSAGDLIKIIEGIDQIHRPNIENLSKNIENDQTAIVISINFFLKTEEELSVDESI